MLNARGRTEPRLWTPPLRPLTPDTSIGFDQIEFARDVLHRPLDPWQEWLVIHAGELLPDGRPRFRIVLVLVARQNGKTEVLVVLACYWQFIDAVPMILGTSTKLDYAKESWQKTIKLIDKVVRRDDAAARDIAALLPPRSWHRDANGEQESWTTEGARYKIGPANREGGRSLTIDRLILDELREHRTTEAWDAAEPAASPWDAQVWALSNAGDDGSVVLNELRKEALAVIGLDEREQPIEPEGDPRVGIFEWSAPPGSDPEDIDALEQANPNAGIPSNGGRLDPERLVAKGRAAKRAGGEKLTGFKTEHMCMRVPKLDPALDPASWLACLDEGDLSEVRDRIALCIDVSRDEQHATLVAAAILPDDRVRVEAIAAWDGPDCLTHVVRGLPDTLARVRPKTLGWLPNGPAASLAAKLADRRKAGRRGWPPPGITIAEIRGEIPAICMGLAREVKGGTLAHSNDPLLNDHAGGAERLWRGDTWVFSRKGDGHCDAMYATAGAVHLARTMPTRIGRPRLITID